MTRVKILDQQGNFDLVSQIEGSSRLVEKEQSAWRSDTRVALTRGGIELSQGRGDDDALLLAAAEGVERAIAEMVGAGGFERAPC